MLPNSATETIHDLQGLLRLTRFLTDAEADAVQSLLKSITDSLYLTQDQARQCRSISDSVWSRFYEAPEASLFGILINRMPLMTDAEKETAQALFDTFRRQPLSPSEHLVVTQLVSSLDRRHQAQEDWLLLRQLEQCRKDFYLDQKEIGFLDNWIKAMAGYGVLTRSQRHYAELTKRRAINRQRTGAMIIPGIHY